MQERPSTRYAKSGDLAIAYQVIGDGPRDLVFVPGFASSIDLIWDFPAAARFFQRLASFSRLIIYDKRSQGLSDGDPDVPSLEEDIEDLNAVLEAVGASPVDLCGCSEGGPMAALFAATYPDWVDSLILVDAFASGPAWAELFAERGTDIGELIAGLVEHWGEGRLREIDAPSIEGEQQVQQFGVFERAAGSPGAVRARLNTSLQLNVAPVLGALQISTLVLHRTEDRAVPVELGREMAAAIPGARFVELPGIDHIPWVGDGEAILDEIEEFLTGARQAHEVDRAVATVMFTDIVDSTRQAAELGDRRWRELLDSHDRLTREQLERYRGREVQTTGDGFLATFDGPARAINCAESIIRRVDSLGVGIRAGLHTGELELRGEDVGGMAVHIGARIGALASGGEVLVSRTVKDLVVGSGIEFGERGTRELKGVPGEWQLFATANGHR
jgi:pimeloyl-ACP methyl ester carboxylesterase/class 3 adenylate cyclase